MNANEKFKRVKSFTQLGILEDDEATVMKIIQHFLEFDRDHNREQIDEIA